MAANNFVSVEQASDRLDTNADLVIARSSCRPCNAHHRFDRFPLLHCLDTFDGEYHVSLTFEQLSFLTYEPALRRRFAPRPKPLSSARLGDSDPSHSPASRRRRGRQLSQYCHDSKQPQEGTQGEAKGTDAEGEMSGQKGGKDGLHWSSGVD